MNHPKVRTRPEFEAADQPIATSRYPLWQYASRLSIVGLFLLAFLACLSVASAILVPIASAVVIGTMLGPLSRRAATYRIPPWLFALLTLAVILELLQLLTMLVSGPIAVSIAEAPQYIARLSSRLQAVEVDYPSLRALHSFLASGGSIASKLDVAAFLQPIVGFVTPALGQMVVFFATLFFYLLGRAELRRELVMVFSGQDARLRALRILNEIEQNLTRYIGTVSLINLAVGLITGLGAYLLGLPNPLLFGVLAFICNFLPYIGPAFVAATLFLVGLVVFPTFAAAFIPPALFVGLATLEGHFITPNVLGARLMLNPLAVFLCLSFWAWLWGPVGAFLSVPFLIVGLVVWEHLVATEEGELPG